MGQALRSTQDSELTLPEIRETIELNLRELFRAMSPCSLKPAFEYSMFPAGKRIRPLLAMCLCQDLGGCCSKITAAALSLEMIHNSSLVHDDLPELDNDDMRRGRPSCHKKFGHGTALLAGDFMVGFAFRNLLSEDLSAEQVVETARSVSQAYEHLCEGQQLDISLDLREQEIFHVHELKTGALFRSSGEIGVIGSPYFFSSHRATLMDLAASFGRNFGVCFQLCNDYQDVHGNRQERGREESSDIRNGKQTPFTGGAGREDVSRRFARLESETEAGLKALEHYFVAEKSGVRSLTREAIAAIMSDFSKIARGL